MLSSSGSLSEPWGATKSACISVGRLFALQTGLHRVHSCPALFHGRWCGFRAGIGRTSSLVPDPPWCMRTRRLVAVLGGTARPHEELPGGARWRRLDLTRGIVELRVGDRAESEGA